jgi:hypothetical protein
VAAALRAGLAGQEIGRLESSSVNALAIRELSEVSRGFDNAALLGALPTYDISISEILKTLDKARSER